MLAKAPPTRRYFLSAGPTASNLVIPPGDGNAEVVSEVTVGLDDAKLVYAQPHMHLRGKDFELRLVFPTGETQTVFKGKFDFEWQLGYDFAKPIPLPKGTRVTLAATADTNSTFSGWGAACSGADDPGSTQHDIRRWLRIGTAQVARFPARIELLTSGAPTVVDVQSRTFFTLALA